MPPTPLDPLVTPSCLAPACRWVYSLAVGGLLAAYAAWAPCVLRERPVPALWRVVAAVAAFVGLALSLVVMLWACPPCGGA